MTQHPPGATLHLGGHAYAHPALQGTLHPNDSTLTPYPGNPRRGDQDAITTSIRDLGLYRTIIAQRTTGHILAGNHTYRALTDLVATSVPVTWVDVDDTRAAAIVARDNRTSDLGAYDDAELLALLTADEDVLPLSGYDEEALQAVRRAIANQTFADEAGETAEGVPLADLADPIDTDGGAERVTVTVADGHRQQLYALLQQHDWVLDVADAHVRKPTGA